MGMRLFAHAMLSISLPSECLRIPLFVVFDRVAQTCPGDIPGISGNDVICCPIGCNQCGGDGCSTSGAKAGLGWDECCGAGVKKSGKYCDDTGEAPCIVGGPSSGAVCLCHDVDSARQIPPASRRSVLFERLRCKHRVEGADSLCVDCSCPTPVHPFQSTTFLSLRWKSGG